MSKTERKPKPKNRLAAKQERMAGGGFDLPPAIQSIDNAAEELFDTLDDLKTSKEKCETLKVKIMGLMRAAKRTIYTYRGSTIQIEGKEKVVVKAPRKTRKRRETMREV